MATGDPYVVKSTDQRDLFKTGANRGKATKGDFSLLPFDPLIRVAKLYEKGAPIYGRNNWRKGIPLSSWVSSMRHHAMEAGQPESEARVEDHFAAVVFNAFGFMYTEERIRNGTFPRELDDIGWLTGDLGPSVVPGSTQETSAEKLDPGLGSNGHTQSEASLQAEARGSLLCRDSGPHESLPDNGPSICQRNIRPTS